mgnify:CR=1 FL=1
MMVGRNVWKQEKRERQVLAEKVEVAPTPTVTPTSTPSPSPTSRPKPTRAPTPTSKPQPKFTPEEIYNFTNQYGGQYGVDPNVIRHVALCESGFKPEAKNYIYAGLFQYDAATLKTFRKKMNEDPYPVLRYNAREAVKTVAFTLSLGYTHLWPNCYPR